MTGLPSPSPECGSAATRLTELKSFADDFKNNYSKYLNIHNNSELACKYSTCYALHLLRRILAQVFVFLTFFLMSPKKRADRDKLSLRPLEAIFGLVLRPFMR